MSSSNFNLRGTKTEIELGINQKQKNTIHYDLDHLAGSWSVEDEKIFNKNSEHFEQIDEALWKLGII